MYSIVFLLASSCRTYYGYRLANGEGRIAEDLFYIKVHVRETSSQNSSAHKLIIDQTTCPAHHKTANAILNCKERVVTSFSVLPFFPASSDSLKYYQGNRENRPGYVYDFDRYWHKKDTLQLNISFCYDSASINTCSTRIYQFVPYKKSCFHPVLH